MSTTKIHSFCARLIGMRYRELSGMGRDAKHAVVDVLADLGAEFCGESGTPCYEVNNEYFRVGPSEDTRLHRGRIVRFALGTEDAG